MKKVSMGLLIVLGSIAVAAILFARPFNKKSVQSYVLRNQDELTNYARKVIEEHPMEPLEWNGWKVYYYADDMVEFCTGSFGLVPSTTYKGFYYSEDDEPHGFQDVPVEFVKSEMDGRGQNQKVIIHNILNELRRIGIGMKQNFRSRRT